MRVIAGKARRIQLKTPAGFETRPTTDRIKETLFNMISHRLSDSVFLDLFAGSGAVGIEALSRGASEAIFVEKNPKAASCIKENLKRTKTDKEGYVMVCDAMSALRCLKGKKFDYIFMDPPYNHFLEKEMLFLLAKSDLLKEDAIIIVEASLETDFSYLDEIGFSLIKRKEYKTNAHIFLERRSETC